MSQLTPLNYAAAAAGSLVLIQWLLTPKPLAPLPPGPTGLPIVGNVADMPQKKEWVTFAEWGRKWGGILSVKLLGRPMIIVNSAQIMSELDKQGSIYSDRPRLEMGGELVGYSQTLVLIAYGARFRTYRKYFSRHIGTPLAMERHIPVVDYETRRFLKRVLAKPDDLNAHLRKLAGGIIMQLTYGYEVQDGEDPFVNLIEGANDNFSAATVPGAFPVDFFPSLKHLPEWLPGMGFMALARKWAKATHDMIEVPFAYTKQQMTAGTARPSFVSENLENEKTMKADEIADVKLAASSMYGGGADTTVSAEYAFFLAMVLNPDVQKKAQAEIDAVVGNDRLPTFADRPHLPYVNAIVSEVLRWNSVAPTGVPHTAMEDGVIGGYVIPKGSIIIANLWNMLHDPEVYPDPFKFDPERHIATPEKAAQRDPRTVCFGYGRRICPGMHLAETSLYSVISSSLAVLNITKAVENGVEITPVHENTSGIISYPEPFKCTIAPRSEKAIALINEEHL
ncbi:putative cytochrome P450 family protein [Lyophyllum shimeji]|uniref:Cytochrome P450 family protein n=1 Tax=Lyophyllum shimeji TaxID=47721 RepID=A0A9P3PSP0_LYOSH|nr:putative cytochrome P450 family protein [Lyophyllum shimeji]